MTSPNHPAEQPPKPRVFTFTADDNDYTACFHAALQRAGLELHKARWSGRWLLRNVRPGDVISMGWPSFLYYFPLARPAMWLNVARFFIFMLALRLRGATIVWTAHNLYPHDGGRAEPAHRVGRYIVTRLASLIGVHGQSSAAQVQREFGVSSSRLVLLEHGNWVGFYRNTVTREAARAALNITPGAFVFLFIGMCKPYKNLEHLVRSHAELQDDSLLWIVGHFQSDAYYEQVTQAAALSGVGERSTIRNEFVPAESLQLYFNACDAVVLPYREILTSGGAMLALSFGRPVVAPRLGTLEELITDDCGVLYDPRSDTALADAMRTARMRPFSAHAIVARAQQFSWDRSAQAFANRVLESRRSRVTPL
jgi:beta-1,4-mannosyltransferase